MHNNNSPHTPEFDQLVNKNVEAIARIEQASHSARTRADVIADHIATFCGKPIFVYVHVCRRRSKSAEFGIGLPV
jgi:uncharacterized membrane protein